MTPPLANLLICSFPDFPPYTPGCLILQVDKPPELRSVCVVCPTLDAADRVVRSVDTVTLAWFQGPGHWPEPKKPEKRK
jgi:hypothetical protein